MILSFSILLSFFLPFSLCPSLRLSTCLIRSKSVCPSHAVCKSVPPWPGQTQDGSPPRVYLVHLFIWYTHIAAVYMGYTYMYVLPLPYLLYTDLLRLLPIFICFIIVKAVYIGCTYRYVLLIIPCFSNCYQLTTLQRSKLLVPLYT